MSSSCIYCLSPLLRLPTPFSDPPLQNVPATVQRDRRSFLGSLVHLRARFWGGGTAALAGVACIIFPHSSKFGSNSHLPLCTYLNHLLTTNLPKTAVGSPHINAC